MYPLLGLQVGPCLFVDLSEMDGLPSGDHVIDRRYAGSSGPQGFLQAESVVEWGHVGRPVGFSLLVQVVVVPAQLRLVKDLSGPPG